MKGKKQFEWNGVQGEGLRWRCWPNAGDTRTRKRAVGQKLSIWQNGRESHFSVTGHFKTWPASKNFACKQMVYLLHLIVCLMTAHILRPKSQDKRPTFVMQSWKLFQHNLTLLQTSKCEGLQGCKGLCAVAKGAGKCQTLTRLVQARGCVCWVHPRKRI